MLGCRQSYRLPQAMLLAIVVCAIATIAPACSGAESEQPGELVLSQRASEAIFPLEQERIKKGETTVLLRLVREENPEHVSFSVSVTLVECRGGTKGTAPVGAMGLYPSGKTEGSYAFGLGPALTRMHNMGAQSGEVCLKLGLKPMGVAADWKGLRVTVTRPKWEQPPAH